MAQVHQHAKHDAIANPTGPESHLLLRAAFRRPGPLQFFGVRGRAAVHPSLDDDNDECASAPPTPAPADYAELPFDATAAATPHVPIPATCADVMFVQAGAAEHVVCEELWRGAVDRGGEKTSGKWRRRLGNSMAYG